MNMHITALSTPDFSTIQAVVLAAGKSTRFAMGSSKLAFPLCGQEMILYPVHLLQTLSLPTIVVTGYEKETIMAIIDRQVKSPVIYVEQTKQLGTGHAVMCTQEHWYGDHILIINGDMPLITHELIQSLINEHCHHQAAVSFVVADCPEYPHSYGRVISTSKIEIIEARDFKGTQEEGRIINAGIYLISRDFLKEALNMLTVHENSQELYITDIIAIAAQLDKKVHTVLADFDAIRGVNTVAELTGAEKIIRQRIIAHWMKNGVYFEQPETAIIDHNVAIGKGTRIGSGVRITQGTRIGAQSEIGSYSTINASILADKVTVLPYTLITHSEIHDQAAIGPFAHLRDVHSIHEKVVIGNFVEVSNSTIGAGSKAKHLTYIGNAQLGKKVNIGAGTITCNYDGIKKNITTIEDGVKVGSNNSLVAPVTLGAGSMTGAGSVITDDVPAHALALARARQVNKENYAQRFMAPTTPPVPYTPQQEK